MYRLLHVSNPFRRLLIEETGLSCPLVRTLLIEAIPEPVVAVLRMIRVFDPDEHGRRDAIHEGKTVQCCIKEVYCIMATKTLRAIDALVELLQKRTG